MKTLFGYILLIILMLVCAIVLYRWYMGRREYFEVYPSTEERVIDTYQEVLHRQPSSTELINATRDITSNLITWDGLRQRMMDSDEYARMIKLQSNSLTPELDKMLSDSRLLREISAIYREVRKKDIPPSMVLPLRDIYIVINYNPFTLVVLLQDPKYKTFEEDLLRTEQLDKNTTLDLFTKTFDQTILQQKSVELSKSKDAAKIAALATSNNSPVTAAALTSAANSTPGTNGQSTATGGGKDDASKDAKGSQPNSLTPQEQEALKQVLQVLGVSPDNKNACPVDATDTNMTPMAKCIQANAAKIFDIHDAARRIEQPHKGDMVLRPEFAWSVPQPQPPVCNSLGQKPLTQPLLESSKLLLGTSLTDASDTQVGSIMPKFEYKEFVDVPLVKK
jgi:hypothetical protein